ncbi:hypothetical protein JOQ06_016698 [Pogonophryne albipinna]|uniref:Secreted protein n=1 Tax=Pogonophryne albipinna TaxID=1090488 RepID=A0AAD6FHK3_9TELE|nr:hypothetical protein JOQ06_016698 [Pogonophryne albipinna]
MLNYSPLLALQHMFSSLLILYTSSKQLTDCNTIGLLPPLPAALTQPSKCRVAIAICYIAYLSISVPRNNRGLSLPPVFISGVHLSRPAVHILLPCRGSSSSPQQSSTSVHLAR